MSQTVERFAGGAIGEPGDRTFLLEIVIDGTATAYLLEKLQVAALAEEARAMLRHRGLIGVGLSIDPGGVHADTVVAFRVGDVQIAFDEDADVVILVMFPVEDEGEPVARELTMAQLDAFAREAAVVVVAGRPACPRCGLAMHPEGHNCPRSNGDLRGHRP